MVGLSALKFMRVTVLGRLAAWPQSPRSRAWHRRVGRACVSTCCRMRPAMAASGLAMARLPLARSAEPLLLPPAPFRVVLLSCSPLLLASQCCCYHHIVIAYAPVRCISTLLSVLCMSSMSRARGRAAIAIPFMALRCTGHVGRTWAHIIRSART